MTGEDLAHLRLLLRAAGVGAAGVQRQPAAGRSEWPRMLGDVTGEGAAACVSLLFPLLVRFNSLLGVKKLPCHTAGK